MKDDNKKKPRPWLRPREVAKSMQVSIDTVYALIQTQQIEAVKFGGQWRISRQSLLSYLQAHSNVLDK